MKQYPKRGKKRKIWPVAVVLLVVLYATWTLLRPLPDLQPNIGIKHLAVAAPKSKLTWPAAGQSAVAVIGAPIFETHGPQTAVPIASTAKVITALTVLAKKPLSPGQQGPTITLSATDVALYNNYAAQDGSLVPVVAGEQISEYQMLQAIMLPSANNIADSLAIWAYGSLPAYATAANQYVANHGLKTTHIGTDASGFSPTTTSTAHDLARLGILSMQNPVLAEIVGQTTASGIPQTVMVKNVNALLGTSNIVGVKTGNTDQAGGVFISASRVQIAGKPVTIVTALAGSATLYSALKDSLSLVRSAQTNFSPVTMIRAGDIIGRYQQPWGGTATAVARKTLASTAWNGSLVTAGTVLRPITVQTERGADIGAVTAKLPGGTTGTDVFLQSAVAQPSLVWRLSHPR